MKNLTEGTVLVSDQRPDAQNRPPVRFTREELIEKTHAELAP